MKSLKSKSTQMSTSTQNIVQYTETNTNEKDSSKQESKNRCHVDECYYHDDCLVLGLIKKEPKDKNDCSYFRTPELLKKRRKHAELDN